MENNFKSKNTCSEIGNNMWQEILPCVSGVQGSEKGDVDVG